MDTPPLPAVAGKMVRSAATNITHEPYNKGRGRVATPFSDYYSLITNNSICTKRTSAFCAKQRN